MTPYRSPISVPSLTHQGERCPRGAPGFSLIEVLLATLILTTLTGMAVALVVQAEKKVQNQLSSTTLGSNAIGALSQMSREIRMAGFPSAGSFTAAAVSSYPGLVATPFVAISAYDLKFEADTNGGGRVEQIEYVLPAGGQTLVRSSTQKALDGTLLTSTTVSAPYLANVQNQMQGKPLFTWDTDPLSMNPFPQNVRTVYINLILVSNGNKSEAPVNVTLMTACQRMSP